VLTCVVLTIVCADNLDEYDSKFIESRDYDYYLQKSKRNVNSGCAVDEMAAYGLVADVNSISDPNPICPNSQGGNCCGKHAQEQINLYWTIDDKHQALYHMSYLKMNRYILGMGRNLAQMASLIIERGKKLKLLGKDKLGSGNSDQGADGQQAQSNDGLPFAFQYHPKCVEAAQKLITIDFVDQNKAKQFYERLNRKAEFMQNSRRGFYCMLCSAKAKKYIFTYRIILKSTIYYSKSFCQMIYTQSFPSIYATYKQWNPFLKYTLEMLMCVKPYQSKEQPSSQGSGQSDDPKQKDINEMLHEEHEMLTFDLANKNPLNKLSKEAKKMFENPLGLKAKGWLELCYDSDPLGTFFSLKCMGFCSEFMMTTRSELMDGNLDAMKNVYDHIRQYEPAFQAPKNNFFNDDVLELKGQIYRNYKDLMSNYNFYRSLSDRIVFEKYDTSFFPQIFAEGVDPMAISKGTTLQFKYRSSSIFGVSLLLLICALFKIE